MQIIVLIMSFLVTALLSSTCFAFIESTSTLPKGIRSLSVIQGGISGINNKFNLDGSLTPMSDIYSVELNEDVLVRLLPEAQELLDAFSQFPFSDQTQFYLGNLKLKMNPQIKYTAPVFAIGIQDNWSVGVSLPFIKYNNEVYIEHTGSNIEALRDQYGGLLGEFDNAFRDMIELDPLSTLNKKIQDPENGFKALGNREASFNGDLQIASAWRFYDIKETALMLKTTLTLPTGPKNDPDDLLALGGFNKTAIQNDILYSLKLNPKTTWVSKAGYQLVLPDTVVKRVPKSESDYFPAADRKENLNRDLGDVMSVSTNITRVLNDYFTIGFEYEFTRKNSDVYSGSRGSLGYNYSLLESDTFTESQTIEMEISFSTVNAYLKKKFAIPFIIYYSLSDIFAGVNTERQTTHALWFMMVF